MERQKYLPPFWCKDICIVSRSNACVFECAKSRDARFFVPIASIDIEDMPPFPFHDFKWDMSGGERLACIGIYTAKLTEKCQGNSAYYEGDSAGFIEAERRIIDFNVFDPKVWEEAIERNSKGESQNGRSANFGN